MWNPVLHIKSMCPVKNTFYFSFEERERITPSSAFYLYPAPLTTVSQHRRWGKITGSAICKNKMLTFQSEKAKTPSSFLLLSVTLLQTFPPLSGDTVLNVTVNECKCLQQNQRYKSKPEGGYHQSPQYPKQKQKNRLDMYYNKKSAGHSFHLKWL